LELETKIRAEEGKEDQGGGLVWRLQDANNYYITRWNPLEDNLRVYKVVAGRRIQLHSVTIKTDPKCWHELELKITGNRIKVAFDGKNLIDFTDDTFKKAGRIGFWAKADSILSFDDLEISWKRK